MDAYTLLLSKVTPLILNKQYSQAFAAIDAADNALTDKLLSSIKRIQQEWEQLDTWQRNNVGIKSSLTSDDLKSILWDLFPDVPVYDCKQYPVLAIANTPDNPVCYGTPIL